MILCRPGRRMSASMSSTRDPPSASAVARLHAVVVLPSSGWLLVTAITRASPAPAVNTSDVRNERNASPKSCGTGFGQERHAVAANRRHQSEQRQPEPLGDVFGRLDGVVEVFDPEGEAEARRACRPSSP